MRKSCLIPMGETWILQILTKTDEYTFELEYPNPDHGDIAQWLINCHDSETDPEIRDQIQEVYNRFVDLTGTN